MEQLPTWVHETEEGVRVDVLVQPRASRTRIVGVHDDRLKIQVTAPPVEGEANATLVAYLAQALGVPKRDVQVLAGATGRRKSLHVHGIAPRTFLDRLGPSLP